MSPDPALLRKWLRYNAVFKPMAWLPLALGYRAAAVVGRYDKRIQRATAAAIGQGLQRVFPAAADPQLRARWLQNYFTMLARETLDVYTLPRVRPGTLIHLDKSSLAVLHNAQRAGRGVIIAMAHYSRVNFLALGLALAGERLGMLTIAIDERNTGFDPIERVHIARKVKTLQARLGGRWVTLADDLRSLYRGLENNETLVILFDAYTPERAQRKLVLPFLGGTLRVSRGIQRLAEKTGARIVYGVAQERGYRIAAQLRPLPDSPSQALAGAVVELERDVRAAPWLWWQWGVLDYIWTPGEDRSR